MQIHQIEGRWEIKMEGIHKEKKDEFKIKENYTCCDRT